MFVLFFMFFCLAVGMVGGGLGWVALDLMAGLGVIEGYGGVGKGVRGNRGCREERGW